MSNLVAPGVFLVSLALACRADLPERAYEFQPKVLGSVEVSRPVCRAPAIAQSRSGVTIAGQIGEFCLSQGVESRVALRGDNQSLVGQCSRIIGQRCDEMMRWGLRSLTTLLYQSPLDGASVDVVIAEFDSVDGSFAWFSRQPAWPSQLNAVSQPQVPPGVPVIGWHASRRATWGLNLYYTPARDGIPGATKQSAAQLRAFSEEFLSNHTGSENIPKAVVRLPVAHRIAHSMSLEIGDALGVEGLGNAAFARYFDGKNQWQVLAVVFPNADSARDIVESMRKRKAAKILRWAPHEAFRYTSEQDEGQPDVHWVIGRAANVIYGVGDDPKSSPGWLSAGQDTRIKMTTSKKQHLLNLAVARGQ